jgi:hypothetical protein
VILTDRSHAESWLPKSPGTAADKFAQYYATIKAGNRFDVGLKQVHGFDLPGFERRLIAPASSWPPRSERPARVYLTVITACMSRW